MISLNNGFPLKYPLMSFSTLVFQCTVILLLLTDYLTGIMSCTFPGQSQVVGPPQPVVAVVGEHIILPCHLEPAVDARSMAVEWTRPDLKPRLVLVWRAGQKLNLDDENPSYRGRTSLLTDKLKSGDISLKLSKVKLSDGGKYKCYVPTLNKDSVFELVVGKWVSLKFSFVEQFLVCGNGDKTESKVLEQLFNYFQGHFNNLSVCNICLQHKQSMFKLNSTLLLVSVSTQRQRFTMSVKLDSERKSSCWQKERKRRKKQNLMKSYRRKKKKRNSWNSWSIC
uniref:Ig-like domain-containing protein n=1 Tax=Anabas testudineus TaxID=64144 RepID=A0A3Q1ICU0_ANATE